MTKAPFYPLQGSFDEVPRGKAPERNYMRRIPEEQFKRIVEEQADRIEFRGFTKPDNKTRAGSYWAVFIGLAPVSTWFVGIALDEGNAAIVEDVG